MNYKTLHKQIFNCNNFSIIPIRYDDRISIMKWRNEQLYHLRQNKPLTKESQDLYFKNVVSQLFDQDQPNQILFSFLENGICIGYGGLVHINWLDKNAEISFLINTELQESRFYELWKVYLNLIEQVAFDELKIHKIFTYAFDIRPNLYEVLKTSGYNEEARLKEHCFFDGKFLDVLYHSKFNPNLSFRKATKNDMLLYFGWVNDSSVRENSYQTETIQLDNHKKWFYSELNNEDSYMLVFENHYGIPVGQVRILKQDEKNSMIGVSNDVNHRSKGYASKMIQIASVEFLKLNPKICINAYIKLENIASEKAFVKAGYKLNTILDYNSIPSFQYILKL